MISQKKVDELKEKFCNPELPFNEASDIAGQLSGYFEDNEIAISLMDNNNDLYQQLEIWQKVKERLSWRTHTLALTQTLLDLIENKLGTGVMLQVYRFHLEERTEKKLSPNVFLPEKDLVFKMKQTGFPKDPFMKFLSLNEKAQHLKEYNN